MKLILAPMTKIQAASYATRMFMTAFTQSACVCRILLPQTVPDTENSQRQPKRGAPNVGVKKIPHRKEPIM